ncbi:MAG: hypothetical protein LPJ95_11600 [Paracoccaceae bacterium]|nr:hypothetical protein [Paracoccaceae bacterium]
MQKSDRSANSPVLPGRFDGECFRRLIELVGPQMSATLLTQLVADLATCERGLAQGTMGGDWLLLRETSHNLAALGGSCGALALHDLAQELNGAAHDQDAAAIARLAPALTAELALLLALVRATPPDGPLPW